MKKNIKPSITIGIPALDESANIVLLLENIFNQKYKSCFLSEVIVVDDGSSDGTSLKVRSYKNKKIRLIIHKERKGIVKSQNDIVKNATSDILVMLDADVLPRNQLFIEEIIKPITLGGASLVGAAVASLPGDGFVERALVASTEFKKELYENLKNQDNLYLCHGRARAMSKKLYAELHWVENVPEDAYSYLYAKRKGFLFSYADRAVVLYKSPVTITDHAKQRIRFLDSKNVLGLYFSKEILEREYSIPLFLIFKVIISFIIKHPVEILIFLLINLYTKFLFSQKNIDHSKHMVAISSKVLI